MPTGRPPLNLACVHPSTDLMSRRERRERVRSFFARADDPYAGGEIATACRLGAVLWVIATGVSILLMPVSPPDAAIGDWGWLAAAATLAVGVDGARRMRSGRMSWEGLYVSSYLAIAQIALLQWLSGGTGSPYAELFLLTALYAGALHPPRRLVGILAVTAIAIAAPLVYSTGTAAQAGGAGLRVLLLSAVALLAAGLMRSVRAQRIGLRHRSDQAEREARIDALTELPNRRAFVEALGVEISRAQRFGSPLSLVVADLDAFKTINDTHGHPAGDACLRTVAEVLRSSLRQYDACFRWGGDEFALLLPDTGLVEADAVCRRATAAVAARTAPDGSPLRITCAPAELLEGMSGEELVAAADAVLLGRKGSPRLRLAATA
jgi:diguanylate cyclase (GGDEF)-like protein